MKYLIAVLFLSFTILSGNAQNVKTINLEQTPGEFSVQGLTVSPGDYVFEVTNNGVDHELGFVLAPKGMTDKSHHIQNAYVTKSIKNGETSKSKIVTLKKGEYVYFCPLNPTKEYPLHVK